MMCLLSASVGLAVVDHLVLVPPNGERMCQVDSCIPILPILRVLSRDNLQLIGLENVLYNSFCIVLPDPPIAKYSAGVYF